MYTTYAASILQLRQKSPNESEAKYYKRLTAAPRPTFQQFVDYLLRIKVKLIDTSLFSVLITIFVFPKSDHFQVKDYNDHWRPFWIHCQICSNQFDIIRKFETIKEDAEVIKGERRPLELGPAHMQKMHELAQMYFLPGNN